MELEPTCAAVACTRQTACLDWSRGGHSWAEPGGCGLLVFPAQHSVCVFSPSRGAPLTLLAGAPSASSPPPRFTSARWLPLPLPSGAYGDEAEVAACASDGAVSVWQLPRALGSVARFANDGGDGGGGAPVVTLAGHAGPACGLAAACLPGGGGHALATVGADATVRLWHRARGGAWGEAARASLRAGAACEAVAFAPLPGLASGCGGGGPLHGLLVAAGGTDCRVHLFCGAQAAPGDACALTPLVSLPGHADWVKSLAFSEHGFLSAHFGAPGGGAALLASASQDGTVRVWRVAPAEAAGGGGAPPGEAAADAALEAAPRGADAAAEDALEAVLREGGGCGLGGALHLGGGFTFSGRAWRVTSHALLRGHGGWVTHVAWAAASAACAGAPLSQPPCLLTACMDKCVRLWRPRGDGWEGTWGAAETLGAGYGGASLGLLAAAGSPCGTWVAGADLHGAVLLWARPAAGGGAWAPAASASGHYGPVTCVAWAPDGSYALTGSRDATVRAWARPADGAGGGGSHPAAAPPWVEVGRPMVHGYEVCALAPHPTTPYAVVVGATEPVLRVLDAPSHFVECVADATQTDLTRAEYAYVPELGLSAKAVAELPAEARDADEGPLFADAHQPDGKDATPAERDAASAVARAPRSDAPAIRFSLRRGAPGGRPREAALRAHGRWAETDKWFGHANEVSAVAARGPVVASACRARSEADAPVFLWCAATGALRARLRGAHTLTVEALSWGAGGRLLSGGRDRCVAVWGEEARGCGSGGSGGGWALLAHAPAAHKRAVQAVAAAPPPPPGAPLAPLFGASGSRDGALRVWRLEEGAGGALALEAPAQLAPPPFPSAVTALSFAWVPVRGGAWELALAVGTEGGEVSVWVWRGGAPAQLAAPRAAAHPGGVAGLAWRPDGGGGGRAELLSGGADGALRWWLLTESPP